MYNFDPNTGQPLNPQTQPPVQQPVQPIQQPTVPQQPVVQQPVMATAPKRSNPLGIVIVLVIVLGLIGVGIVFPALKKVVEERQNKYLFIGTWVCGSNPEEEPDESNALIFTFKRNDEFSIESTTEKELSISGTYDVSEKEKKGKGDTSSTNYIVTLTGKKKDNKKLDDPIVNEYEMAIGGEDNDQLVMINVRTYSLAFCKKK